MDTFLPVLMRVLHILSAVTLVGGAIHWRFAMDPDAADGVAARAWKPFVWTTIGVLLASGIYNFLHKTGLTPAYHAIFGIKILLALHVFAVGILLCRENNVKRRRQLTGVVASGVIIVILSGVLRSLTLR